MQVIGAPESSSYSSIASQGASCFRNFALKTGASHSYHNVGTVDFYPQVRVGHQFLLRRRTPTLQPAYEEVFFLQSRPLHDRI
jgi:hypothetical protein